MKATPGKRILIVKLSSIGDVVHCLPVPSALKSKYPDAYIAWVVEERAKDILSGHPQIDEIIVLNSKKWQREIGIKGRFNQTVKEISSFFRELKARKFDVAIDLQGLAKSGLITLLSGAPLRIGFDRSNSRELNFLFTNLRVKPSAIHVIDINLNLLQPLGILNPQKEFYFHTSPQEEERAVIFLQEQGVKSDDLLFCLNPGAGWPTKRWPPLHFAQLAKELKRRYQAKILLSWGPGEEDLVGEIKKGMEEEALITPQTTLKELIALIRHCHLFVGGDTGPLHIAVALGIPTVAIYGASDPWRNGPWRNNSLVVKSDLPCVPCWKTRCKKLRCLESITKEKVLESIEKLISDNGTYRG